MNDMQIDRLWTLLNLHTQELNKSFAQHAFSSNGKKGLSLSIDQNISLAECSDTILILIYALGISHLLI
ncbi:DEHA2F27170p [Debaryomyces hansenii CBS767]|jgi:hypothetical protein|uniref:DEHA2F27170p n=1 Tax=Debaryomyces hansenii (strain ATCC 36239 / CBS 767 / BCRC 21394 / JCM 1990 / NBRC 0083 / IGC 2968) TaxID=284592 RepID=Q6BJV2_DEBHA|nr:DEHA2F27170p [Debaryomyces hansenii CBS767]CAG89949.1 DEHA2F27170p [Debaryomyces hansenii CBS767]|eukprot:XP_461519.1 DEHA2F27170p [Debaryomyces hansenii CBS767]